MPLTLRSSQIGSTREPKRWRRSDFWVFLLSRAIGGFLNSFDFFFVENFFLSDPEMKDETPISYLSHKEKYESAVKRVVLVLKKIQELQAQGRAGVDIYMYENITC